MGEWSERGEKVEREMGGRTVRGMREWDRSGLRVIEWSEKRLTLRE